MSTVGILELRTHEIHLSGRRTRRRTGSGDNQPVNFRRGPRLDCSSRDIVDILETIDPDKKLGISCVGIRARDDSITVLVGEVHPDRDIFQGERVQWIVNPELAIETLSLKRQFLFYLNFDFRTHRLGTQRRSRDHDPR